jgi:hypothetical protein
MDHLAAATYKILIDGSSINANSQSDIKYLADKGWYRVSWFAQPTVLKKGPHLAERYLLWDKKVTDGWDWFGPGTDIVTEYDFCEIIVR